MASAMASFSSRLRELQAQQRLRLLDGAGLGEVDDVDRRPVPLQERLDRLGKAGGAELVLEGYRPSGRADDRDGTAGASGDVGLEHSHVAQGRRQQDLLSIDELEQRNLPRPPALGVGEVVELVHHDLPRISTGPPRSAGWPGSRRCNR